MWMTGLLVFVGWLLSVCLHEYGHAIVAYWGGDKTVKEKGYLSFNPLKYTDPATSLVFPLLFLLMGGLALPGGAVYINHSLLRNRWWESAVSLAGPATNAMLALLLTLPFQLGWSRLDSQDASGDWLWAGLAFLALLQISAVLLNLLPIPSLDGYGILSPWLPSRWQEWGQKFGQYGFWVLLGLFWFVPPFSRSFWNVVDTIGDQIGLPFGWVAIGTEAFQQPLTKLLLIVLLIAGLWYLKQNGHPVWQTATTVPRRTRSDRSSDRTATTIGSPVSGGFQTWSESKLKKNLLVLMNQRQEAVDRLIALEKLKSPGKSDRWYLEKVIYDLQRGR